MVRREGVFYDERTSPFLLKSVRNEMGEGGVETVTNRVTLFVNEPLSMKYYCCIY